MRGNVWYVVTSNMKSQKNQRAFEHPAVFPEPLIKDLIISFLMMVILFVIFLVEVEQYQECVKLLIETIFISICVILMLN